MQSNVVLSIALAVVLVQGPAEDQKNPVPQSFGLEGTHARDVTTCLDGGFAVVGDFKGTVDFQPGKKSVERTARMNDGFLSRYSAKGDLRWVVTLGNGKSCRIVHVAAQEDDSLVVWGEFSGKLDLDAGSDESLLDGKQAGSFLAKYDKAGGLEWCRRLPSFLNHKRHSAFDPPRFHLDPAGNFYLGGMNLGIPKSRHPKGGFLVKCDAKGKVLWKKQPFTSGVTSLTPGAKGRLYVACIDMIEKQKPYSRITHTRLICLQPDGEQVWSNALRVQDGRGFAAHGLTIDDKGNLCMTASLHGTVDLDPGEKKAIGSAEGGLVVSRYNSSGGYLDSFVIRGEGQVQCAIRGHAMDGLSDLYVCASFKGTVDLDPGPDEHLLTAPPSRHEFHGLFVAKYTPGGKLQWVRPGRVLVEQTQGMKDNYFGELSVDKHARQIIVRGTYGNSIQFEGGPKITNKAYPRYQRVVLRFDREGAVMR